jgi:hypothetical protein
LGRGRLADEFIVEKGVDAGWWLHKDGSPAELGRGYAPQQVEVGSMKPKWIRFRKREKEVDPEGVLQTGLWLFSATCGATLLLAACNGS